MIFTSPSSARGNLDVEPAPEPRGKRKKMPSRRPPVATQLRMDGQVTARAIAYAAVQVCESLRCPPCLIHCSKLHFSLCDATHWMSHYNGFNYEEFYEFVIDFFEADQTPEGKIASRELYNWWNKCVPDSTPTFAVTDTFPDKYSQGPPLLGRSRLPRCGSRRLRSYENNVEPAYPAPPPSFF
jgi:hypothetical protein